ncbi:MAG: hypothetical protein IKC89_06645 [Lentisphaeria bacterium]|nr:hypothetical protein [Lentisphaeria bacterium]
MLITTGKSTGYLSLLTPETGVSARAFCVSEQEVLSAASFISSDDNSASVPAVESAYIYNENADVASSACVSAEFTGVETDEFSFDGSAELDETPVIGVVSDLAECGCFKLCAGKDFSSFCITVSCCEALLAVEVICAVRRAELLRQMQSFGKVICVLTQKFRN